MIPSEQIIESQCFPDIISPYVRFITKGNFLDIKSAIYLKTDDIDCIEVFNE